MNKILVLLSAMLMALSVSVGAVAGEREDFLGHKGLLTLLLLGGIDVEDVLDEDEIFNDKIDLKREIFERKFDREKDKDRD